MIGALLDLTGRLNGLLKRGLGVVSSDNKRVNANQLSGLQELGRAWKDPQIAAGQKAVVDEELRRMHAGDVVGVYQVFADAVLWTGVEAGTIVEVGCGAGHYREVLRHLVDKPITYIGVDYSTPLLRVARDRCPDTGFLQASAAALPFRAKSVEILVSGCVLLHMPEYEAAIRESARVAKEWVIFHRTPVVKGPTVCYTKLAYGVKCIEIAFGQEELSQLFLKSGLTVVKSFDIGKFRVPTTSYMGRGTTFICRVNPSS